MCIHILVHSLSCGYIDLIGTVSMGPKVSRCGTNDNRIFYHDIVIGMQKKYLYVDQAALAWRSRSRISPLNG